MKKRVIKYAVLALSDAKFSKMASKDAIAIIKEVRKMRQHAEQLDKDLEMLEAGMEDEQTKSMREMAKSFESLSNAERIEVNEYFLEHKKKKDDAARMLKDEEVELEITKPSEEVLEKLIESNDFNGQQLESIIEVFA